MHSHCKPLSIVPSHKSGGQCIAHAQQNIMMSSPCCKPPCGHPSMQGSIFSKGTTCDMSRPGQCICVEADWWQWLLLPCNFEHDCKTCLTAICRCMQQVCEATPWLEVKRVASANAASVAHSLSSAYPGCWCIGHASCDRAAVLWPKDTP